ncbi:hypothetical protein [Plesiocystis pacifica]|nr:hypothetical protein [Plesiocystis pacifica]
MAIACVRGQPAGGEYEPSVDRDTSEAREPARASTDKPDEEADDAEQNDSLARGPADEEPDEEEASEGDSDESVEAVVAVAEVEGEESLEDDDDEPDEPFEPSVLDDADSDLD